MLSSSILWVVAAFLWLCLGMAAASMLYPLSDSFMVPGVDISQTIPMSMGLSVALPIMALLAIGFSLSRQLLARYLAAPDTLTANAAIGISPWLGILAVYWAIVALAMMGVYSGAVQQEMDWVAKYRGSDILVFLAAAFVVPSITSVLLAWRRGQRPGFGVLVVAQGLYVPGFSVWLGHKILSRILDQEGRLALQVWSFLQLAIIVPFVGYLAYFGTKEIAWGALTEGPHTNWQSIAIVSIVLSLLALAILAVRGNRNWVTAGAIGVAIALTCAAFASYFYCIDIVEVNLRFLGGWEKYTPPMNFIMTSYGSGAWCILALMLLIVRYFFTFFTTVSIGGVTIGTMALVIVLSVMSGFENDLRGKILGFNAHIQISKDDELQFKGYQEVQDVLEETEGVVGYTPFLITEAYMSNHNNYGNVTMKGIDPARVAGVTEIVRKLEKGDERALEKIWPLAPDGSILGKPDPDDVKAEQGSDLPSIDDGPLDLSGGLEEVEDEDELDLGGPVDYSGGLDEIPVDAGIPDADVPEIGQVLADGGVPAVDTVGDGGASGSARVIRKAPRDSIVAGEWETQSLGVDYIKEEIAILDGVLVGRELVKQISLYTDQEIRIISPLPDVSPDGLSIPRIKNYRIAGKFFSGMYEYDLKYVYCNLGSLQSFLDLEDVVNGIEVRVSDPTKTGAIVTALQEKLGDSYRIQDWKELNKALFSALKLEKIAMFFVLVIIVLVASFSIVGNLIMVVIEKAKEIAILKTLGSSNGGVMKIFITQGFFIGLVGTGLGVGLGLGACYLGMVYGVPLNPDVYYIDKLPILIDPSSIMTVGFAGIAISVLATIYPAFIAARMRPVKGLRWD